MDAACQTLGGCIVTDEASVLTTIAHIVTDMVDTADDGLTHVEVDPGNGRTESTTSQTGKHFSIYKLFRYNGRSLRNVTISLQGMEYLLQYH